MTITILKREPGQKIPRPFARVSGHDEAVEVLQAYATRQGGGNHRDIKEAMERAASLPQEHAEALGLKWIRFLDTDMPVVALGHAKFYAFTEE